MISSPTSLVVRSRSGASIRNDSRCVDDGFELAGGDGAFFAGAEQAAQDLLPVEALAAAVFFHDHVGDFVDALVGGEAAIAALALAAAADGVGLFALARVDDAVLPEAAIGTLHMLTAILRHRRPRRLSLTVSAALRRLPVNSKIRRWRRPRSAARLRATRGRWAARALRARRARLQGSCLRCSRAPSALPASAAGRDSKISEPILRSMRNSRRASRRAVRMTYWCQTCLLPGTSCGRTMPWVG